MRCFEKQSGLVGAWVRIKGVFESPSCVMRICAHDDITSQYVYLRINLHVGIMVIVYAGEWCRGEKRVKQ
jgi:hypothetical protein